MPSKPKSQVGNIVAGVVLVSVLIVGAAIFLELRAQSAPKTPQVVTVCGHVTSNGGFVQGNSYRLDFKSSSTTTSAVVYVGTQSTNCGGSQAMYSVDLLNQAQYNVTLYPGPYNCGPLYLTATSSPYNYDLACG